jgi:rhodanese-related sulfurtransferase
MPGLFWDEGRETIMKPFRIAVREASFILVAAVFLGFAYTAVAQKGLFARYVVLSGSPGSGIPVPPEIISVEEAREFFASGRAVFIDTRDEFTYRHGRIKGAINIPLEELAVRLDSLKGLSSEKILIPYCDGTNCHSSIEFANRLFAAGISRVKIFFGGWEEWTAGQLPVETALP